MFRINRDVRFSKDKSPYKTNASAVLSRDGTKAAKGVFYFHVGGTKREAMMAVGFYGPEPSDLAALRTAMVANPKGWARVTESASVSMEGALARMPKGFETHAAEPIGSALKLRSLVAVRHVEIERVYGPGLIDDAVAFAKAGLPLLEFGWKALRS